MLTTSILYFVVLSLIIALFSIPLCVVVFKSTKAVDFLLIPILGILNLTFLLFIYATINYFINIRQFSVVVFVSIFLLFETLCVIKNQNRFALPVKFLNFGHFLVLLLLSAVLFIFLTDKYFDHGESLYFHPGYGINHDSMNILSSVKVFDQKVDTIDNPMSVRANTVYNVTGYPLGGTYSVLFFSKLFGVDPYLIYQQVLLYYFIIVLFVVNYFVLSVFRNVSFFSRFALITTSILCVINYLTLNIINSSVLGSTIVTPFLLLSMFVAILYFYNRINSRLFAFMLFISIVDSVFLYSYINVLYFVVFCVFFRLVFLRNKFYFQTAILIIAVLLLAMVMPLNLLSTRTLLLNQFLSTNTELNLFKGMMGNTIGFINPITAFSLWFFNQDYRYQTTTIENIWLFFSVMALLLILGCYRNKELIDDKSSKILLSIILPFTFFVVLSYWVVKSPYQNVKTMFLFSVVWPIVVYLILFKFLQSKKILHVVLAGLFLCGYTAIVGKSALMASAYVGKPIVRSNYELMKIEPELCNNDKQKLFVGRDEMSVYFLLSCSHIRYFYDRFENNSAFWEVIKLNNLTSLDQKCDTESLKLTRIDLTGVDELILDKCFKFDDKAFELKKEYGLYKLFVKKN